MRPAELFGRGAAAGSRSRKRETTVGLERSTQSARLELECAPPSYRLANRYQIENALPVSG